MKNDQQVSANFKLSEYFIHQLDLMDIALIDSNLFLLVQQIRNSAGCPITITSGYRCVEKNRMEGGAKDSQHLYGRAADICSKQCSINRLYSICEQNNLVTGFGDGRKYGFIHIDVRKTLPEIGRAIWRY